MRFVVYLPLLATGFAAVGGPWLAARLPARAGLWTVTGGVVAAAAGSTWSLLLLVATLVDELPGWERESDPEPVPDAVAVGCAAVLAVLCLRAATAVHRRRRLYREVRAACPAGPGELVVLADDEPRAFALPGGSGRIVVSAGMLRALTPPQRRVLLAHERAHLHGRHHLLLGAADLSVALNPLLLAARHAVAFCCERAADESAAAEVGDRALTARALAVAALAGAGRPHDLGFGDHAVLRRVTALRSAPPPGRPVLVLAAAAVCLAVAGVEFDATVDFARLLATLLSG
ncbi:M48 family metalloprotease [Longispora fulva]|uniref:Zn-dependent protease with chaperone function n=1 Tax=Longispora fulva TaxID=619741 RepID=A0A8J7GT30_9ACTN|nr:M48 family metalloprotease [Longispora fulva]MBG6136621.1 Zn-dependent protease with chaperone function [Longispora fulva]